MCSVRPPQVNRPQPFQYQSSRLEELGRRVLCLLVPTLHSNDEIVNCSTEMPVLTWGEAGGSSSPACSGALRPRGEAWREYYNPSNTNVMLQILAFRP